MKASSLLFVTLILAMHMPISTFAQEGTDAPAEDDSVYMDDGDTNGEQAPPDQPAQGTKKPKAKLDLLKEEIDKEMAAKKAGAGTKKLTITPTNKDPVSVPTPKAVEDKPAPKSVGGFKKVKQACDIFTTEDTMSAKLGQTKAGRKIWTDSAAAGWLKVQTKTGAGFVQQADCF
jgi:hypothetical protein